MTQIKLDDTNKIIEKIWASESKEGYLEVQDDFEGQVGEFRESFDEDFKRIPINRVDESFIDRIEARNLEEKINEVMSYLDQTDWMEIREWRTGKVTPPEILEKRAQSRIELSALREELAQI